MDKRSVVFASDLFLYLARSYKLINPAIPLCSTLWKTSTDFNEDIGKAALALSYSYRTVFRKFIEQVFPYTMKSVIKTRLYAQMFAKKTCSEYSPFKFLVFCSFVSELYLFHYYNLPNKDAFKEYVEKCVECFGSAFDAVLSKTFPQTPGYQDLKAMAKPLASGYNTLMPVYANEHPNLPTPFLETFMGRYRDGVKKYRADGLLPTPTVKRMPVPNTTAPVQKPSTREPKPENMESKAVKHYSADGMLPTPTVGRMPVPNTTVPVQKPATREPKPENLESKAVKQDTSSKAKNEFNASVKSESGASIKTPQPMRAGQRRPIKKK